MPVVFSPFPSLESSTSTQNTGWCRVKECAISYLGMQKDDFVSVAEVFSDDKTQGLDVKVQGKETPTTGKCFVVVKDGQASIVTQPGEGSSPS